MYQEIAALLKYVQISSGGWGNDGPHQRATLIDSRDIARRLVLLSFSPPHTYCGNFFEAIQ
jgi:hypothetical protein